MMEVLNCAEQYQAADDDQTNGSSRRRKRIAPKRIEMDILFSEKKPSLHVENTSCDQPQNYSLTNRSNSPPVTLPKTDPFVLGSASELKFYADKLKQQPMSTCLTESTGIQPNAFGINPNAALFSSNPAALLNNMINPSNDTNNNLGSSVSLSTLVQVLQLVQQQQQHQQLASALANLPFNGLLGQASNYNHTTNTNTEQTNADLSSMIRFLPLPSPGLPNYQSLYSQYLTICNHFQNLVHLISQYTATVQHSMKSVSVAVSTTAATPLTVLPSVSPNDPKHITTNHHPAHSNTSQASYVPDKLSPSSGSQSIHSSMFERTDSSISPTSPSNFSTTRTSATAPETPTSTPAYWLNSNKKASPTVSSIVCHKRTVGANGSPVKKTTFRGTSEAENLVDPNFKDINIGERLVQLSEQYPNVLINREAYVSILSKSSKSATRIIRLLMKHFFSQDDLAASSLSGEGIYKQRLNPDITEAIKSFIRRRHPNLKNGSISLCMTDVCVQARRVANNQRSRSRPSSILPSPEAGTGLVSSGGFALHDEACSPNAGSPHTSKDESFSFVPEHPLVMAEPDDILELARNDDDVEEEENMSESDQISSVVEQD